MEPGSPARAACLRLGNGDIADDGGTTSSRVSSGCQRLRAGYCGVKIPSLRHQPVEFFALWPRARSVSGAEGLDLLHRATQQTEHVSLGVSKHLPRGIGGLADVSSGGAEGEQAVQLVGEGRAVGA